MAKKQLTLKNLSGLEDGLVAAAFQAHLKRATEDCYDRPANKTARTVTMKVSIVPVLSNDLSCNEVHTDINFTSTTPKHQTRVYSMGVRAGGMLVVDEDVPDNINQSTIFRDDDEGSE